MLTIPLETKWQRLHRRRSWLWTRKHGLWIVLLLFLIVGILLILVQSKGFFHEVGIAAIIASFLGFSIDIYLQQRIARDAFEGAMGYFLPDDLKEAVRYIGAIDWFAEEFSLTIKLETLPDELVRCTIKVRKYLRNVSPYTNEINSYIHIDDWGHPQKSYLISCSIKTASVENNKMIERTDNNGFTLHGETDKFSIYPRDAVECLAEAVEIKRLNDDFHYVLAYCARSPKIYVEAPEELEILAGLNAAAPLQKHPHTNLYELPGFYLPWQEMVVRWFPRGTSRTEP